MLVSSLKILEFLSVQMAHMTPQIAATQSIFILEFQSELWHSCNKSRKFSNTSMLMPNSLKTFSHRTFEKEHYRNRWHVDSWSCLHITHQLGNKHWNGLFLCKTSKVLILSMQTDQAKNLILARIQDFHTNLWKRKSSSPSVCFFFL